jgi:hypothetical protein
MEYPGISVAMLSPGNCEMLNPKIAQSLRLANQIESKASRMTTAMGAESRTLRARTGGMFNMDVPSQPTEHEPLVGAGAAGRATSLPPK